MNINEQWQLREHYSRDPQVKNASGGEFKVQHLRHLKGLRNNKSNPVLLLQNIQTD